MSGEAPEAAADSFDDRKIDLTSFTKDITAKDWATQVSAGQVFHPPWFPPPIEVISPTKTLGKGRTNLTLGAPDILQVDAATPFASYSFRSTPAGGPFVSVHFEPSKYGISTVQTYIIAFVLQSSSPVALTAGGFAGGGSLSGTGPKTLNGNQVLSVVMSNVPANAQVNAFIQQTSAGGSWTWFSTSIEFPPLVFTTGTVGATAH